MGRGAMRTRVLVWMLCVLSFSASFSPGAEPNALDQLKAQFNKDQGVPRIILLVSPT